MKVATLIFPHHSFIHPFTHLRPHARTHARTHSLTPSLAQSLFSFFFPFRPSEPVQTQIATNDTIARWDYCPSQNSSRFNVKDCTRQHVFARVRATPVLHGAQKKNVQKQLGYHPNPWNGDLPWESGNECQAVATFSSGCQLRKMLGSLFM